MPFSFHKATPSVCALRTGSGSGKVRSQEALGSAFVRRPIVSPAKDLAGDSAEDEASGEAEKTNLSDREAEDSEEEVEEAEEEWVDWEDKILEDTVPLVGFVRMILHSGRYQSGDRLSPEHERTILEKLLPYHPDFEKKTGCGIDYITVGYHPDFQSSRCLFIVRKDGELVDFSYWKCVKGLIRKKYPLYADSFILRHFRRRRQTDGR
ncbi:protein DCL homolog, chloroplastic isoform X1 [Rhodamnia argentea]|uniref:Protein DCL homolog, chloroplastic isoform X1 n=1 Tax=Rhodamnia argentea TaxID=178133 RepID=A0A8B8PUF8_9MYRT|nr:protein DCL homolog, chloroplastic isoform X1 [Rhodamnia argentea]